MGPRSFGLLPSRGHPIWIVCRLGAGARRRGNWVRWLVRKSSSSRLGVMATRAGNTRTDCSRVLGFEDAEADDGVEGTHAWRRKHGCFVNALHVGQFETPEVGKAPNETHQLLRPPATTFIPAVFLVHPIPVPLGPSRAPPRGRGRPRTPRKGGESPQSPTTRRQLPPSPDSSSASTRLAWPLQPSERG